jgi:hypothetical protein
VRRLAGSGSQSLGDTPWTRRGMVSLGILVPKTRWGLRSTVASGSALLAESRVPASKVEDAPLSEVPVELTQDGPLERVVGTLRPGRDRPVCARASGIIAGELRSLHAHRKRLHMCEPVSQARTAASQPLSRLPSDQSLAAHEGESARNPGLRGWGSFRVGIVVATELRRSQCAGGRRPVSQTTPRLVPTTRWRGFGAWTMTDHHIIHFTRGRVTFPVDRTLLRQLLDRIADPRTRAAIGQRLAERTNGHAIELDRYQFDALLDAASSWSQAR